MNSDYSSLDFGIEDIDTDYTLKMAAKAIGLSEECVIVCAWNPLYSQADAFELQSKLRLEVSFSEDEQNYITYISQAACVCGDWDETLTIKTPQFEGDVSDALRLGLTVAASKIGELMDD